jgi:hypothetical protein
MRMQPTHLRSGQESENIYICTVYKESFASLNIICLYCVTLDECVIIVFFKKNKSSWYSTTCIGPLFTHK